MDLCQLWLGAQAQFGLGIDQLVPSDQPSHIFTITWPDGGPAALLGVTHIPDDPPDTGFVWMVAKSDMDRRPQAFLRRTRGMTEELFSLVPYERLHTYMSIERTTNLFFSCRWQGFEIIGVLPPIKAGLSARFAVAARRGMRGPRPMLAITVELGQGLRGRFPGNQGGRLSLPLPMGSRVADLLAALCLAPDEIGAVLRAGRPLGLDEPLMPKDRLALNSQAG